MYIRFLIVLLISTILGIGNRPAHAQLLFMLNPAGLSGLPGGTLTFNGTLTNTGPSDLFLNGIQANLFAPDMIVDVSAFFINTPASLSSGESVTADLFQVLMGVNVPNGKYVGSIDIIGGTDGSSADTIASQGFQVSVGSSAPEPSAGVLLSLALGCGAAVRYRGRTSNLSKARFDNG